MAANNDDNSDFMEGPLIIWLKSCLEDPNVVTDYNDLVDGVILYQVLLQIDPDPTFCGVVPSHGNPITRIRNLDILLKNLRNLYQEEFGQIVIKVPNIVRLGTECSSPAAKQDLRQFLLLLLSCAVQCPNKQVFIERITALPLDVQHSIVHYIKQFTDAPLMVLSKSDDVDVSPEVLLNHVRHLVKERDEFLVGWAGAASAESSPVTAAPDNRKTVLSSVSSSESHHLAVEVAEWKSRLRKLRQELEEKTESLTECRDELEQRKALETRLRQEVADVVQEARSARAYRDELDAMREKAERAEKLEMELERLKAKLRDVDYYKTRVEQLCDDNRVLMETREMLEKQLITARRRGDRILDLEADIVKLKQLTDELTLERDAKDRKLEELYAEQAELQVIARSALQGDSSLNTEDVLEPGHFTENNLSSQLTNNATARALKLELENHRLRSTIDSLKESAFHEGNLKLLESEKENKRLLLNIELIDEQCKRLTAENNDLQLLGKDALLENRKLEESRDMLRASADLQQIELQAEREKLGVLRNEVELLRKEKEAAEQLIAELEKDKDAIEEWQQQASVIPQLEQEVQNTKEELEAAVNQSSSLQKEIQRLKEIIESKNVCLDQLTEREETVLREKKALSEELMVSKNQVLKLYELEREKDEIVSRAAVAEEAVSALQNDLVHQKVEYQQLKSGLERLGITTSILLDPSITLANLLSSPEFKDKLPQELREECQQCSELGHLQEDNAQLQVLVTTLQSQITSLSAQHTAVQLANTQLVAEKEQLEEERKSERATHERLLSDQTSLRQLHEQLTSEHESLLQKQEALRQTVREKQLEIQKLMEQVRRYEISLEKKQTLEEELQNTKATLKNLREEHSKLKEDFQSLFSSNLKLKNEYRAINVGYKEVREEAMKLRQGNAVLEEKLTTQSDNTRILQMQVTQLVQANMMLEEDRRSVMEHASTLLAQYQELFTHSLEDNQHYHNEEKQFVDKLNELRRQKEKLEEKIMDQYRKIDSTTSKKKGFGAILVKKVRKAGSDLMNRSRRSLHEDSRSSLNIHGSESGENESDVSLEDTRNEEATGPLLGLLKQQGAGTRQTVYEADSLPTPSESDARRTSHGPNQTLLVINRMSNTTVLNTNPSPPSPSPSLRSQTAEDARRKAKENSMYYDYGCV